MIPMSQAIPADVTILTIGAVLYRALRAAKTSEGKVRHFGEVIDTRSIAF